MSKSVLITGDWDETVNGDYDIVTEFDIDGTVYYVITKNKELK